MHQHLHTTHSISNFFELYENAWVHLDRVLWSLLSRRRALGRVLLSSCALALVPWNLCHAICIEQKTLTCISKRKRLCNIKAYYLHCLYSRNIKSLTVYIGHCLSVRRAVCLSGCLSVCHAKSMLMVFSIGCGKGVIFLPFCFYKNDQGWIIPLLYLKKLNNRVNCFLVNVWQ